MPDHPAQTPPLDCLVSLLSFETYWAYYLQSDGHLYGRECKACMEQWFAPAAELLRADEALRNHFIEEMVPDLTLEEALARIRDWMKGEATYPFESAGRSRFMLFVITTPLKERLLALLGTKVGTGTDYTFAEMDFQRRQLLWGPYLSRKLISLLPEDVPGFLSQSDSIALIGDIRRSQDLMTYGPDAEFFSRNMLAFLETSRRLLAEHNGVFDKFTGDGFLAYFNAGLCARAGRDPRECLLGFVRALAPFCAEHFSQWSAALRKTPGETVGLALGADVGRIMFRHEGNVLFAVGDSIVWASRMCAGAGAGELIVNNLLAGRLAEKIALPFEKIPLHTKAGESFLGQRLRFQPA